MPLHSLLQDAINKERGLGKVVKHLQYTVA